MGVYGISSISVLPCSVEKATALHVLNGVGEHSISTSVFGHGYLQHEFLE